MKRVTKFILAAALLLSFTPSLSAQNILKNLGNALKDGTVTDVVTSLIGTKEVGMNDIVGTWVYDSPSIVLESDDVLSKIGGTAITSKGEKYLEEAVTKCGLKSGAVSLTFNADSTYSCTFGGRQVKGTYSLEGANLTLKRQMGTRGINVTANVNRLSKELQLAVKADKLLTLLESFSDKMKTNSSMSTFSSLLKKYKGMQAGLKFKKK